MEMHIKILLLAITLLWLMPVFNAEANSRKLLSTWSTDCQNLNKSRRFALEYLKRERYLFSFCVGFKCIPYPGFAEPFDVYDDKRVKWISDEVIHVSNNDKTAGWEGHLVFTRCSAH